MHYLYAQYAAFEYDSFEYRLLVALSDSVVILLALTLAFALLALWLRWQHRRREQLWQKLHALWDADVLNVLSGDMKPIDFRKLIKREHELDFVRFIAQYGWRLRGSDLELLKELVQHYMPHAARRLKHREPGVRAWAVNVIGLFGMPEYEHEMFEALEDESAIVVMFAANTLLAQKRAHYIVPVLEQLQRFERWNVNALAKLIATMGADAIPILEQLYLDDKRDTRTRIVAALALAGFADYAIADAAAAMLPKLADVELKAATLRLLSRAGSPEHRHVVKKLCEAPKEVLRINAMRTLRALCTQEDREFLLQSLNDKSPWVARQAMRALRDLGATDVLEKLVREQHPRALLARQVFAEAH